MLGTALVNSRHSATSACVPLSWRQDRAGRIKGQKQRGFTTGPSTEKWDVKGGRAMKPVNKWENKETQVLNEEVSFFTSGLKSCPTRLLCPRAVLPEHPRGQVTLGPFKCFPPAKKHTFFLSENLKRQSAATLFSFLRHKCRAAVWEGIMKQVLGLDRSFTTRMLCKFYWIFCCKVIISLIFNARNS